MAQKKTIASESWISKMSNMVKSGGGINLAQGIPGFDTPEQLLHILRDMSLEPVHQYPPGNGQDKLLKQICNSYSGDHNVSTDEVLVVQGATEGVSLVFTYMNNRFGNEWSSIAFDPVYETYNELPKIFNKPLIKIPFHQDGVIDRDFFEKKLETENVKMVFVNSPGNPFGKVWNEEEFEWIFGLAEKFDFYILMDAVYKDLYYGDEPPFIPLSINRKRIFYVDSYSKMLSITGWRVGYLITDAGIMKNIRAIHDYTGLCAPSILQYSISEYLANSDYAKEYTSSIRMKLNANYYYAKLLLEGFGFSVAKAGGGYFIWCELPNKELTGAEFAIELYEKQKVGVVPGIHFSEDATYWIRINIAREKKELAEALNRIQKFL